MMATESAATAATSSTPFAHNLSHVSRQTDFKAINSFLVLDKFAVADLEDAWIAPFDAFLIALGVNESILPGRGVVDRVTDVISKSPRLLDLLREYCEPVENEKQRYGRFCELVNHISHELGAQNVIFCRNDPNMIQGSHSNIRSPDVIAVKSHDDRVANERWRTYHSGSNIPSWRWGDILFAVELKLKRKAISMDRDLIESSNYAGPSRLATAQKQPAQGDSEAASGQRALDNETPEEIDARVSRAIKRHTTKPGNTTALKRKMQAEASETTSEKRAKLEGDKKESARKGYQLQLARYGMDQMSHVHNRCFCFGLLVLDSVLYVAYYDRIGIVHSAKFDFVTDKYRLVLLIKALCSMTSSDAGFLDSLERVSPKPVGMPEGPTEPASSMHAEGQASGSVDLQTSSHPVESALPVATEISAGDANPTTSTPATQSGGDSGPHAEPGPPDVDSDGVPLLEGERPLWKITLGVHVFYLFWTLDRRPIYGLITRGTLVYLARCLTMDPAALYVVKLSWPLARRTPESSILDHARRTLEDLDKGRDAEFKSLYGDEELVNCLPRLHEHRLLADLMDARSFRKKAFEEIKWREFEPVNRIWYAIAYEYLVPIYFVPSLNLFKKAIREVVLGHHFLSSKGVLHRDISDDNIMFRARTTDHIQGVLNDWDLATIGAQLPDGHTGTRTGTRPYMAIDLLAEGGPPEHIERFDWESFFYVICRIGCRYSVEGMLVNSKALSDWDDPIDSKLVAIKRSVICDRTPLPFTEYYKPLVDVWIEPLREMFSAGINQQRTKLFTSFDDKTMNGAVTWNKFWDIVRK